MKRPVDLRRLALALIFALAFFALGLLAARFLAPSSPPSPSQSTNPTAPADAGAPRIFFDPSSISLLPDASLELTLPNAPDASTSAP